MMTGVWQSQALAWVVGSGQCEQRVWVGGSGARGQIVLCCAVMCNGKEVKQQSGRKRA